MAGKIGINCKLYYGAAGSKAATLLTKARDVTLNMEKGEADMTDREADGWESVIGGLKSATVDFDLTWDSADAGCQAILAAFLGSALALFVADAATGSGGQGLDADFEILKFSQSQPLREGVTISCSAKISTALRVPAWDAGT